MEERINNINNVTLWFEVKMKGSQVGIANEKLSILSILSQMRNFEIGEKDFSIF